MMIIEQLEKEIGMPVISKRKGLDESHDETFSYTLALKYYGNEKALKHAIVLGNKAIVYALRTKERNILGSLFSLVGNMYYIRL